MPLACGTFNWYHRRFYRSFYGKKIIMVITPKACHGKPMPWYNNGRTMVETRLVFRDPESIIIVYFQKIPNSE